MSEIGFVTGAVVCMAKVSRLPGKSSTTSWTSINMSLWIMNNTDMPYKTVPYFKSFQTIRALVQASPTSSVAVVIVVAAGAVVVVATVVVVAGSVVVAAVVFLSSQRPCIGTELMINTTNSFAAQYICTLECILFFLEPAQTKGGQFCDVC